MVVATEEVTPCRQKNQHLQVVRMSELIISACVEDQLSGQQPTIGQHGLSAVGQEVNAVGVVAVAQDPPYMNVRPSWNCCEEIAPTSSSRPSPRSRVRFVPLRSQKADRRGCPFLSKGYALSKVVSKLPRPPAGASPRYRMGSHEN
jgi:hypothetical protein